MATKAITPHPNDTNADWLTPRQAAAFWMQLSFNDQRFPRRLCYNASVVGRSMRCQGRIRHHHDNAPREALGASARQALIQFLETIITHRAILVAGSRPARIPGGPSPELTKGFISGPLFKLTHYRGLTPGTKKEQCSSYVPITGGGYVEGIRGRGGGTGVDRAVCRDDRGLGATVRAALKPPFCCGPLWRRAARSGQLGPDQDRR